MTTKSEHKQKIRLRPHVEVHGQYSLEWSYHFPLESGYLIESQFDLHFSGEKISGAAKTTLSEANLSHTRFSFADSAATFLTADFLQQAANINSTRL